MPLNNAPMSLCLTNNSQRRVGLNTRSNYGPLHPPQHRTKDSSRPHDTGRPTPAPTIVSPVPGRLQGREPAKLKLPPMVIRDVAIDDEPLSSDEYLSTKTSSPCNVPISPKAQESDEAKRTTLELPEPPRRNKNIISTRSSITQKRQNQTNKKPLHEENLKRDKRSPSNLNIDSGSELFEGKGRKKPRRENPRATYGRQHTADQLESKVSVCQYDESRSSQKRTSDMSTTQWGKKDEQKIKFRQPTNYTSQIHGKLPDKNAKQRTRDKDNQIKFRRRGTPSDPSSPTSAPSTEKRKTATLQKNEDLEKLEDFLQSSLPSTASSRKAATLVLPENPMFPIHGSPLQDHDQSSIESSSPLSSPPPVSPAPPPDVPELSQLVHYAGEKCTICGEPVDELFRVEFFVGRKNSARDEAEFCHAHKKKAAEQEYREKGYPQIDWSSLNDRLLKYHHHLRDIMFRQKKSRFRERLVETIDSGKERSNKQQWESNSWETSVPGYYGTKGARKM
jgi:hypothetical protein